MTEITIEQYAGKMNRAGYDAFIQAMRQARSERNRYVDLAHWLFHCCYTLGQYLQARIFQYRGL